MVPRLSLLRSFAWALSSGGLSDRPILCSVISQKKAQGQFLRRSVRIDERAYLHDRVSGLAQLYDTSRDPEEQRDLAESPAEAPTRAALDALLRDSMRGNLGAMPLGR